MITNSVSYGGISMRTKGLTEEVIVEQAIAYIQDTGQAVVSLHEVARRLGVKAPSLYNHIKNTKELQYEIVQYAIEQFAANQKAATQDKKGDEAIRAFAQAYYTFATENKGLYRMIMSIPLWMGD